MRIGIVVVNRRLSIEIIYGINTSFVLVDNHLGISNQIIKGLLGIGDSVISRLSELCMNMKSSTGAVAYIISLKL